jgi:hypothetical protein
MRIKILQFVAGDYDTPGNWFSKHVEPINRMYCDTYGYEYVLERLSSPDTLSLRDRERGLHWLKVPLMRKHLSNCDFLLYLDADCVFYNHLFRIEEELLPLMFYGNSIQHDKPCQDKTGNEYSMLFAVDVLNETIRPATTIMNSGVCLVRNNETSRRILERWDGATDVPGLEFTRWEHPNDQLGFMYGAYPYYRPDVRIMKDYYLVQGRWGYFIRHVCLYITNLALRDGEFRSIFNAPIMERNRLLNRASRNER